MNGKLWEALKKPVFASERSRKKLGILKRIVLLVLAGSLAAWALPESVFFEIARIDSGEEFRIILGLDLWAGPVAALIVILLAHEYLPQGKIRRFAIGFYLVFALYVSGVFLMMHINQVAVRSGRSPWFVVRSLLKVGR